MLQYGVRKLAHTLLVALGVVTLVFAALRLSGDPAATMLPGDASVEELVALRKTLGLDKPLPVQYASFLVGAVTGDFGISFRHQQPALGLVMDRLPATLELAFAALVLAVVVAVPLGIIAALNRGRLADVLAMAFAVVGQATPYFWMGIMLILIVSVELGWLPTSGRGSFAHLILPAITLGTHFAASLARLTRTAMLEVLGQNYVTTARAKGLPERTVILAHALKNASVPVVTLIGLQFGTLLGGAVVTDVRQPGRAPAAAGVGPGRQCPASSRHRSPRAGSALAPDLGSAHLVADRAGRHRPGRRRRLADRPRQRLLSRPCRPRRDEADRRPARVSVRAAGHRGDRRGRRQHSRPRHRAGHRLVGRPRAHHPWARPEPAGARLRAGGASAGRPHAAHPVPPPAPRDLVRHPDPGHLRRRADHHSRIYAVLPRPGRAAAHAVMGLRSAGRRGVRTAGVVDVRISGAGHHGRGARRQPGRRCAARCPRSADSIPGPGLGHI